MCVFIGEVYNLFYLHGIIKENCSITRLTRVPRFHEFHDWDVLGVASVTHAPTHRNPKNSVTWSSKASD